MIITRQEENYIKIQSGDTTLLIDPTSQRSFKGAAAAINTVRPSYIEYDGLGDCFWIDHQGEYEIQGIHIRGWSAGNEEGTEKTIYRIEFDDIILSILGHITQEPSKEFIEYLDGTDIMIVPAGGKPWVSQVSLAKFIRQIEPSVIIPSLFKDLKPFLKECNVAEAIQEEKFVFKKKDLTTGAMEIRNIEEKK
jgi:hypothetical protein